MKISKLELSLKRGGQPLSIPPKSVKFFTMSNFTKSIQMISPDSVDLVTYCDLFILAISGFEKKWQEIIKVIKAKNDITAVNISLEREDGALYSDFFRVGWEDRTFAEGKMENPYQSVYLSKPGDLYLVINSIMKVGDYFDLGIVDTEEWSNKTRDQVQIGI